MGLRRWHGVHQGLVPDTHGPLVRFEDVSDYEELTARVFVLEEALRTELTHGGVNDEIAQASMTLGALARVTHDEEDLQKIGQRLDKARDESRARLEAALHG